MEKVISKVFLVVATLLLSSCATKRSCFGLSKEDEKECREYNKNIIGSPFSNLFGTASSQSLNDNSYNAGQAASNHIMHHTPPPPPAPF